MKTSTARFFIAAGLGAAIGAVDTLPMLLRGVAATTVASVTTHWMVIGVITTFLPLPTAPWLRGAVVATGLSLPVCISRIDTAPGSIPPILVFGLVLGTFLGLILRWLGVAEGSERR